MNNKYVFITPMYNATKTLSRMLHSIAGQSYKNWKVILVDDVSNDDEVKNEEKIINGFKDLLKICDEDPEKIEVYWNKDGRGKSWEVSNVLFGINKCKNDDIICRIDADDWIVDSDALNIIDSAYCESNCDVLWTNHRWGYTDKNISSMLPKNADPYKFPWVTSHLKTFKKELINSINDLNFRGSDGEYIKRAGDQAIYLPILYKSNNPVHLPRCVYHYNIDETDGAVYQTDDARFQRDEALFLRSRGFVR